VERLKQALAAQRQREDRLRRADREAYDRLKRAHAASKAADTPAGAAVALKAATRELKPLDIVRIFEAERASLQEATAAAAAEARAAEAQLQRAQEALHAAGLPCEHFDELEGQARAAMREAAVAAERAAQLEQEATVLRSELAERPTQASSAPAPCCTASWAVRGIALASDSACALLTVQAQLESLQRQVAIMERQLAKAAEEKNASQAKEASRHGRSFTSLLRLVGNSWQNMHTCAFLLTLSHAPNA
jgi:hypothetical protein